MLRPGDPLPRLLLPDLAGAPFDFTHQSVSGMTHLMLLRTAGDGLPTLDEAVLRGLEAVEARPFLVLTGAWPKLEPAAVKPLTAVLDGAARLPAALGLKGGGIVVVAPDGRIEALLPITAMDEAMAMATSIFERSEPAIIGVGAPALLLPAVIEPELIDRLRTYWDGGEKLRDRVASRRDGEDTGRNQVKRRTDVIIQDADLFAAVRDRLLTRVVPAMRRALGFEAASFEALRIGCYAATEGGRFARHRDNSTPFTAHRRFAMTLNLNTGDYAGGQLRFPEFGRQLYEAPRGGCVVFACSLLHEACPVTEGLRFAMFTFFTDAAGMEREKRLIAEQSAKGKGYTLGRSQAKPA